MAVRPRPRRKHKELEARIRANCCEFHGLTPAEMERHVYSIIKVIERATG